MRRFVTVLAISVLVGCSSITDPGLRFDPLSSAAEWADLGRECRADAPATEAPVSVDLDTVAFRDFNVTTADIARRGPGGYGGYFINNGRSTIYLVDPSQVDAAVAFLRSEGVPVSSPVDVLQGRWDFAQLYDWYRYLQDHVWAVGGVHGSDIQEARNRLEYFVLDEASRTQVEQVLGDLEVPCFLVAIDIQPMAVIS